MSIPRTPTDLFRRIYYKLFCMRHSLSYQLTARGHASRDRLEELKDTQLGKRCFIIGNGPSLRQTDLTKLRGEATFGLNRIYLLFPEMGFPTTYLLSINKLVI